MLAIVIPYFKKEFFRNCLESLRMQTSQQFNVYIGDDGSPSPPADLIKEYSDVLKITYKRFPENLGGKSLVSHWNRCMALVKDEKWITILGDDDRLGPTCVEDFYSNLNEINNRNLNVVRFATVKIDERDNVTTDVFIHPEVENSLIFFIKKITGRTRSSLSEYIFRKKALDMVGLKEFPLAWHTDDLAIMEVSNFKEIFTINSSVVEFRNSGINISTLNSNAGVKNEATFLFYHFLLENYNDKLNYFQKRMLFHKLEKAFLNDKRRLKYYLKYFHLRWRLSEISGLSNFFKQYILSVFRVKANRDNFPKINRSIE